MPLPYRRGLWSLVYLALVCFGFAALDGARAQGQKGNSADIEKKFAAIKFELEQAMGAGDKKPGADVLDTAAKYFVYRVTWPSILDAKADPGKTEPIQKVVTDFNKHIALIVTGKRNGEKPEFTNAYSPFLVSCFSDVLSLPVVENSKAVIFGAQMLPALAKLQHPSIDDFLTELIDLDPKKGKHDIIKLWAIIAMRELPPVEAWSDPANPVDLQNKIKMGQKTRDLKRVEALTRFILRPPPVKGASEDDYKQELEAYRYLRREALETLGKSGAPAVAATKLTGKVEGPIAPILLRALIPGQMVPETNLQERNEAALGLCNMKPMGNRYDSSNVHFFIALTLAELVNDYAADLPNIVKKDGEDRLPTRFPWKLISRRWEAALKQHITNTGKDKRAVDIESIAAKNIIKGMFGAKGAPPVDGTILERMLPVMAPKGEEIILFQGLQTEPIKLKLQKDE